MTTPIRSTLPAPLRTPTRRRTAPLAAVVLVSTLMLATCAPIAAQATESTPAATATATVEASPTGTASPTTNTSPSTKTETVTVGAGMLVAISEAPLHDVNTESGEKVVGELAPGDSAPWSSYFAQSETAGFYTVTDEYNEQATVNSLKVFAFPQKGLKLDRDIQVRSAIGKANVESGFGAKLGPEAMVIRTAPSAASDSIMTVKVGQKYSASTSIEGEAGFYGTAKWLVIHLPADADHEYGFIRREATEVDKDPTAPAVVVEATEEPGEEPDGEGQATAEPSATDTASITATKAPVVEKPAEPAAVPAPEEAKDNSGLVIGGLSAVILALLAAMGFSVKRRKDAEATDSKSSYEAPESNAPTKPIEEPVETFTDVEAEVLEASDDAGVEIPALTEETVEDINWDED